MLEMVEDGHDTRRFQMPCDSYSDRDHTQWRRHVSPIHNGARMMIRVLAIGLCPCVPHVLHSGRGSHRYRVGDKGKSVPGFVEMLLIGALTSFVMQGFRFGMSS